MEAPKRPNYPYLITRDTCPSRAILEVFRFSPSDGCPATATLLSLDASLAIPMGVLRFEASRWQRPGQSDRPLGGQTTSPDRPPGRLDRPRRSDRPPGRLNRPGWPHLLVESSASANRCSLCQSLLMTRLPRSLCSTLVLRLNQETVHDFVPLFLAPCGPHLTPLATGSLEPSLLVFSTPGGLTGNDLSRLFFTCTNTSQAATCTCNT
jgi:hypothetical protein